jgi:predicted HTH domain antitoxin
MGRAVEIKQRNLDFMTTSYTPENLPDGPWQVLLQHALKLIDEIQKMGGVTNPTWTFGGGTVLMLRYQHRLSKDVDIFVADPQYLGFVTPRLSDLAESISTDKVETAAEIVAKKLFHRGNRATARDLFDLAMVIEKEHKSLSSAAEYLTRYRSEFLQQIEQRRFVLEVQFEAVDRLEYEVTYEQAVKLANDFLKSLD